MEKRRHAHVVIIGAHGTSYGLRPPPGTTWKSVYLREVADRVDANRIHFVGRLPYQHYLSALQISSAHVYLTYPFVLSWSLLESMSAGCAVVGSDTPPVAEVINGDNGLLVPFFDVAGLADRVIEVLANPRRYETMREKARQTVVDTYDAERICVPRMLALVGHGAPSNPVAAVRTGVGKRRKSGTAKSSKTVRTTARPKSAPLAT